MGMRNHWSYLKYVLNHKRHVYNAGRITRASIWGIFIHDWSKFMPSEWVPYVASFYNSDGSRKDWKSRTDTQKSDFNSAWNHHQKTNAHHWQYWILINDNDNPKMIPLEMPIKYVREMVADWVGAGIAINGKMEVGSWYQKNKDKIILHDETRKQVEFCIYRVEEFYRIGRQLGFCTR